MRKFVLWATALLFLLAALHTVTVRREVYDEARKIGEAQARLREQQRRNDNLAIERERLASPDALLERAERIGLEAEEAR